MAKFLSEAGVETLWELITAEMDAVKASCARVAIGSYTGANKSGESYPNSLTFDFKPQLVVVMGAASVSGTSNYQFPAIFVRGSSYAKHTYTGDGSFRLEVTWTENGLSWYYDTTSSAGHAVYQLNSAYEYVYIAVGAE